MQKVCDVFTEGMKIQEPFRVDSGDDNTQKMKKMEDARRQEMLLESVVRQVMDKSQESILMGKCLDILIERKTCGRV